jgi:hypothetical protein
MNSRVAKNPHAKFGAIGQFLNFFLRFLQQNPWFYQVAVTSSSMMSHRAYPQNDSGVARNLQAKFGADWRVSKFSTIFFFLNKIRGSIRSL